MMLTSKGSCHCGAVSFEVDWDPSTTTILDCNCSMCRKKGFLHLIVPAEAFRLQGSPALQEYRFNTGVAVHRFCPVCGIHAFYTPRSHPDAVDVNVRCLDGELPAMRVEPFDGANWEANVDSIR